MKVTPLPYPQTRQSACQYFYAHGISVSRWAREMGLSPYAVKDVLLNRTKGVRGQSHKAAVALGIKPIPKD